MSIITNYSFVEAKITNDHVLHNTFAKLKKIRKYKKRKIIEKLTAVHKQALNIKNDEILTKFLVSTIQLTKKFELIKNSNLLEQAYKSIHKFKYIINKKCILSYGMFYNVLFVDNKGRIIHRRRVDNYQNNNLFKGELANTKLAKHLIKKKNEDFVDFDFFPPSNRISAFFPIPIFTQSPSKKRAGWIILQYSMSNLNNIVLEKREVGKTGEVLLVNKNYHMLTKSKFKKNISMAQKKKGRSNKICY